ncbi:SemiSWEET family transporter [Enterococcus faecalis]|uniref:SemiSWEET family transporter n=1 Tax=Enterococcus faecalis TaxID=1351 RepID=UPI00046C5C50|nr:SemiSWEET family transporter [Enterococcus faecalis]
MKETFHKVIGSIGAAMGIFVFLAYIPQIIANLEGAKGQPWQPLFAAVSCLVWVLYGWSNSPKKDYILIIPNFLGVILGFMTFVTSF